MKKIIIILILAIVGTTFYSCTKLDEIYYDKIPGHLYPENDAQIANLSVDAYKRLQILIDDNGWWFLAQEMTSDEFCCPVRGSDWFDGGKWLYLHTHQWTNDIDAVNTMWSAFWEGITSCNQIIDMLNTLEDSEAIHRKKAEVEVVRSFYYYLLLDNYGDAPYLTTANLPSDFLPTKISRKAIFDSVTTTVANNIKYLKDIDNKYMATRYMAYALLAKLYLNAEVYTGVPQWEKAGLYCDSVMAGPYSLEADFLAPFKTNNQNSSEIIFSIPFDENTAHGFRLHMRSLHYQSNLTFDMPVGPWNGLCAVYDFYQTYEDNDARKSGYFMTGQQYSHDGKIIIESITNEPLVIDPFVPAINMQEGNFTPKQIRTTGARVLKYEIKLGAKENLSNDFPLFRLSDIYLMKAETEIRLGRSGDQWINPIRRRAGVAEWNGATLQQLLDERGRELWVEGHRRQDQIRFGKWESAWWEKPATTPERRTFPIPKWATDSNPNLL